ncbi:uncharacterized protein B0I36DRAFT_316082 [Microdochium trichocladiopsis]|uniref:Uncharacterized protein n=1 Tax=Microdochium trichocladiopsis TaxID=1682393 RepID=A0A9P9BYU5_9PEZI|nr:uncharacterized protein B0I36DRAFT_316082 [Microdochium trichocladiopsis]KAH7038383.1 hypothetical protein B0I36DRAFT_316082 [Microdochium trichocladiopsis]
MPFRIQDSDPEARARAQIQESISPDRTAQQFKCTVAMPRLLHSAEEPLPCHEPIEETTAISAHLSARIHTFFQQLAAHDSQTRDASAPASHGLSIYIEPDTFEGDPYCYHRKYNSRRLQLQDPETLPDLPFVRSLTVESLPDNGGDWEREAYKVRPLSLLWPLRCLVHLPRAEELRLPWMWERPMPGSMPSRVVREHYTRPWEGPLRDARHEFGAAMADQEQHLGGRRIPASLTRAALHFWTPRGVSQEDQAVPRPNLIYPAADDRDPLSLGLRTLASQLHFLDLRALITKDLFPVPGAPVEEQWRHMRRMRIEFHPLRPDGRWYFVGPRGEDPNDSADGGFRITEDHYPRDYDTEEDQELDEEWEDDPTGGKEGDQFPDMFRTEPCRERIEPLLAAFARAVAHGNMPDLQDAELFAYLWWYPGETRAPEYGLEAYDFEDKVHRWGVKYVAGGDTEGQGPVVQWQVGDWRPSPETMSLFESLGRQEWLDLSFDHTRHLGDFSVTYGRAVWEPVPTQ